MSLLFEDAYFASTEYLAKSAQEKLDLLWEKIVEDTTPASFPRTA